MPFSTSPSPLIRQNWVAWLSPKPLAKPLWDALENAAKSLCSTRSVILKIDLCVTWQSLWAKGVKGGSPILPGVSIPVPEQALSAQSRPSCAPLTDPPLTPSHHQFPELILGKLLEA